MASKIISIICDFDGTLGGDMISFLLQKHGVDVPRFWDHITEMVQDDGWDPAHAYMHELLNYAQSGKIELTRERLGKLGSLLPLYPGIPELFPGLRKFIKTDSKLKAVPIELEYYIVSGGLEQMIRGTKLARHVNGIFGCEFQYDTAGRASAVKRTISFTEKTKFVYAINKGIEPEDILKNPYLVNDAVKADERRIPFEQMIYIGDGPSDIPCMSMIKQNLGEGIGVCERGQTFQKGYELARGGRLSVGPYSADYRKTSDMRKALEAILVARGAKIDIELRKHVVEAPKH
jgi:2-hydroxy-3-keto-5-methylthiopentenyl-1-phosphate phosphatase